MKASGVSKHRVVPVNLRSGAKAPYFVIETNGKKDEVRKMASEEFKERSSLFRSETWDVQTEKI